MLTRGSITAVLLMAVMVSTAAAQGNQVERIAYNYTAMYEAISPSIVKVLSDGGHGSGFLVSENGFVVTNHHVVRNSRYLAVQFPDGRKVKANLVVADAQYDVAVLHVNPSVVASARPLPLLPEAQEGSVRAGIPVVAFGSPLSQTFLMTQGIVSKVEDDALLGDFLIEPGNSGGPLVNLQGEVIGVNTFGVSRISGAVRVRAVRKVLASEDVQRYSAPSPSADLLPTLAATRYPTDMLKSKILSEKVDPKDYQFGAGKFTVTAVTPVLMGRLQVREHMVQVQNRLQRRGKKAGDPSWREIDGPFYEWMRDSSSFLNNGVLFKVEPQYGMTTGSKWLAFASGLAAGLSRTAATPTHQEIEYKAEFQDFRLYVDGKLIEPVTPGRLLMEVAASQPYMTFIDEAYAGAYVYSPDVFVSGREFRFEVYDAREPNKIHDSVVLRSDSKLIQQLRADFKNVIAQPAGSASDDSRR